MNTDNKRKLSFSKSEHLISKKDIARMFEEGIRLIDAPLSFVYLLNNEHQQAKILISVSKKKFKKAVDRNRIKRLLRETYRINKNPLTELLKEKNMGIDISISLTSENNINFHTINEKMNCLIQALIKILNEKN